MAIMDSWILPALLLFADLLLVLLIFLVILYRNKRQTPKAKNNPHNINMQVSYPLETSEPEAPKVYTIQAVSKKKLRVVGRRENKKGANTHYKLSDDRIVTRAQAVKMVKKGELPGYQIMKVKGVEYLRDEPDTKESDNIDNQELI